MAPDRPADLGDRHHDRGRPDAEAQRGGARLETDGEPPFVGPPDEYPDIYKAFAMLLDQSQSKMEAAPFQLVADAFMLGRRTQVDAFEF